MVVVAVLATILVGMFAYLFVLDKKVTKIEHEVKEESNRKEK